MISNNKPLMSEQGTITQNESIDLDIAMSAVGGYGKYQIRITFIFSLLMLVISFIVMSPTYLFATPDILCHGLPCETTCLLSDVTFTCPSTQNIITDMMLFCEKRIDIPIIMSVFFLGGFSSGLILGQTTDSLGRRVGLIASISLCFIGSFIHIMSYTLTWFLLANYMLGLGCFGSYNSMFIIINECFSKATRQQTIMLMLILWAVGQTITAVLYYFFHQWRWVYLFAVTVPLLVVLFCTILFVKETAKFYYAKQKMDECCEILNQIGTINNRQSVTTDDLSLTSDDSFILSQATYNILDIFKYPSLRMGTIGLSVVSITIDILYYGCQFGFSKIARNDDLYIIGISVAISEIFCNCILYRYVASIKRVSGTMLSLSSSIIICFAIYFAQKLNQSIIYIVLALLERIFITLASMLMSFHPFEFYPTVVRSIGSGFVRSIGLTGSILAPFLIHWSQELGMNPYFMLGLGCLGGPLAILLVRETRNQPLKNQITETEDQSQID